MKEITLYPQFVCSRQIDIVVDDDNVIQSMKFLRGCSGNLQGISRLCIGHKLEEVSSILEGIRCPGSRTGETSCPDQLAKRINEYLKTNIDTKN
ncbi:MAG: TIGR03905 family TSCPD domain-containing protein [Bacilli bacterium]